MGILDLAPRGVQGWVDAGEALWQELEKHFGDDPELLEECRARRNDALALRAWMWAKRPTPLMDGRPMDVPSSARATVPVPETFPGYGPASDHLHETPPGGYRCLICRDAGFVRRDVPVGHPDFGKAHKCRCRLESDTARAARELRERLHRSNLPAPLMQHCTLETFKPRGGTRQGRQAVENWLEALRMQGEYPRIVALYGETGAGKTHLLVAGLMRAAPLAEIAYVEQWEFLRDCKANRFADDEMLTARALTVDVLALDAVGGSTEGNWGTDKIERILMQRYKERRFTLLGMEISTEELEAWSPRLASRLSDREVCLSVGLTGGDYRGQKGAV